MQTYRAIGRLLREKMPELKLSRTRFATLSRHASRKGLVDRQPDTERLRKCRV